MGSLSPTSYDPGFELEFIAEKSFVTMVSVDLTEYLQADKPVKKTLSIPKWADDLGQKMRLNFSQTLTEAILAKSEELN